MTVLTICLLYHTGTSSLSSGVLEGLQNRLEVMVQRLQSIHQNDEERYVGLKKKEWPTALSVTFVSVSLFSLSYFSVFCATLFLFFFLFLACVE